MTTQSEALAALDCARAWVECQPPPPPPPGFAYPPAIDCLAGTMPPSTGYVPSEYQTSRRAVLARQQDDVPDGSIVFLGDSTTEGWGVEAVTPGAWNGGIAGEPMIGLAGRLASMTCLHRAGCVVWFASPYNDLSNPNRWWSVQAQTAAILAALTGPLVVVRPPAIDPATWVDINTNGNFDLVTAHLISALTGRAQTAMVDGQALMSGANGYLKPEWQSVGPHPNCLGYRQINPVVQEKIAQLVGEYS